MTTTLEQMEERLMLVWNLYGLPEPHPLPEEHEYDEYEDIFGITMEASANNTPHHKEIWICEFKDFDRHAVRPALIIDPHDSGNPKVMVLGSIKRDGLWEQYKDNVKLKDWKKEGLKKATYASINNIKYKNDVDFGRCIGKITEMDYQRVIHDTDLDTEHRLDDFEYKLMESFILSRNTIIRECPDWYEELVEIYHPRWNSYSEVYPLSETYFVPQAAVTVKDIWSCDFPMIDSIQNVNLRYVAVIDFEGTNYVVEIIPGEYKGDASYLLKDWQLEGFSVPSTFVGTNMVPMEQVNFYKKQGTLTDDDYERCIDCIKAARKLKFQTPQGFMIWLKSENVKDTTPIDGKNNNNNPLQTIFDIGASKEANCVDIALAMRAICLRKHLKHWIIQSMFVVNEHLSGGHVYCVYEQNRMKYAFRFIPEEPQISQIKNYGGASLEHVIQKEVEFLREHWEKDVFHTHTKNVNRVFNEDELEIMDDCVARKTTQRAMLNMLKAERR